VSKKKKLRSNPRRAKSVSPTQVADRTAPAEEGASQLDNSVNEEFDIAFKSISQAQSLADLMEQYAFFTPAILFCVGGLDRDPMEEFAQKCNEQIEIFNLPVTEQLFYGLEDRHQPENDWNHYLFGIQKDKFEDFNRFMMETGIIDWERKYYASVLAHDIEIIDPLAKAKLVAIPDDGWPMVTITVYGLRANLHTAVLATPKDIVRGLPSLFKGKPDPAVKRDGKKLFSQGQDQFFDDMEKM